MPTAGRPRITHSPRRDVHRRHRRTTDQVFSSLTNRAWVRRFPPAKQTLQGKRVDGRNLFVIRGRFFKLRVRDVVVLNPELCARPFHKRLDRGSRGDRLVGVEFRDWDLVESRSSGRAISARGVLSRPAESDRRPALALLREISLDYRIEGLDEVRRHLLGLRRLSFRNRNDNPYQGRIAPVMAN